MPELEGTRFIPEDLRTSNQQFVQMGDKVRSKCVLFQSSDYMPSSRSRHVGSTCHVAASWTPDVTLCCTIGCTDNAPTAGRHLSG